MKYIQLLGNSIEDDIDEIKRSIDENNNIVFVYSGSQTLYDYIDALHDNGQGLDDEYLYKFKVCYEKTDLRISYDSDNYKSTGVISSMSSLIGTLDNSNSCRIIIENNDRVQLSFIVQQLIYIEYPLEKVDILLRKEERDAAKTKRFMQNVDELMLGCKKAVTRLSELRIPVANEPDENNPTKDKRLKDIDDALDSCRTIQAQLEKSMDVELKFAVAASKKAGKSVIVNCFLGEQIAPTSTELATPNNCFYKKSPDNMYHLQLEGDTTTQNFADRKEIYKVINEHFRNAQNDKEDGFALPDMHIGYVTDENNFSSYTIFDTAGPDAAGTAHSDVARKAMQQCDVAVFAIDYAKYLTTSEEDYLREIKEMFSDQNKFHSLIFALNKIDIRYTDTDSPKSFVMSVDFLKTRLANIDEKYRDCIIFPTCSLEYFSAIEAEKAGVTELDAKNNLPIDEMKKVKFAHRDVSALAWLHTHSENLQYYHGFENISYDIFKKDSGMPALMSYVSYVAQSKARDEIINNVTFMISAQKEKIQSVLDFISNIETLINSDDDKIKKISAIIDNYVREVRSVLDVNFNRNDLSVLDNGSLLKTFGGDYEKILNSQRDAVTATCEKEAIANDMYGRATETIWNNLKKYKDIDGNQIDKLLTSGDLRVISNEFYKKLVNVAANKAFKQLSKLSDEVKCIVKKRQDELKKKSDACRICLEKEDIKSIEMPELPSFEFATRMTPPKDIYIPFSNSNLNLSDRLSSLFRTKFFANIGKWLFSADAKEYKKDFMYSDNKKFFLDTCQKELLPNFKNVVYENNVTESLQKELKKIVVDQYMRSLVTELKNVFEGMNRTYMSCIERFQSAVDDRDKYKADIALHNLRKANIMSIRDCTNDFMQIWNIVINDLKDNETSESDTEIADK